MSFPPFSEGSFMSRAGMNLRYHSLMSEIRWDKNKSKCCHTLKQNC